MLGSLQSSFVQFSTLHQRSGQQPSSACNIRGSIAVLRTRARWKASQMWKRWMWGWATCILRLASEEKDWRMTMLETPTTPFLRLPNNSTPHVRPYWFRFNFVCYSTNKNHYFLINYNYKSCKLVTIFVRKTTSKNSCHCRFGYVPLVACIHMYVFPHLVYWWWLMTFLIDLGF